MYCPFFSTQTGNVSLHLYYSVHSNLHWQTTLEAIQESVSGAMGNKNPNVKAETVGFLARALCYCTPAILSKKLLKALTTDLLKTLNESG